MKEMFLELVLPVEKAIFVTTARSWIETFEPCLLVMRPQMSSSATGNTTTTYVAFPDHFVAKRKLVGNISEVSHFNK
jgi:hypothetical protein